MTASSIATGGSTVVAGADRSCCPPQTQAVENSLSGFFTNLWDTSSYPPRWNCGSWTSLEGWLHIVSDTRAIAESLGGSVTVTSERGKGSTFSLRVATGDRLQTGPLTAEMLDEGFPQSGGAPPDSRASRCRFPKSLHGRVLLVEDGIDNRRLIAFFLQKLGASVVSATNGVEGVEAACMAQRQEAPFDLMLMDIQMPVMDGFEAVKTLRSLGYEKPVVALTARVMKGERERCLTAGFDDYLSKPIVRQEFERVLSKFLPAGDAAPTDGDADNAVPCTTSPTETA